MLVNETIELSRLRQAQHALHELIASGFDVDGSHRIALGDLDRVITGLIASRWRGTASNRGVGCDATGLDRAA